MQEYKSNAHRNSAASIELVVLGLLAALIMVLAIPLLSNVTGSTVPEMSAAQTLK